MGFVEVINQLVPPAMAIEPGTIVLGMILDPLSGRSPLSRLEECLAHQDTALLRGQAIAPGALDDATVGRGCDRRYETGTMPVFPAGAVRADQVLHFAKRYGHFDTTSMTGYGDGSLWVPGS